MTEILDLIYQVFEELKEAKESQDQNLTLEKEKELDRLRKELVTASKRRGLAYQLTGSEKNLTS